MEKCDGCAELQARITVLTEQLREHRDEIEFLRQELEDYWEGQHRDRTY